MYPHPMPIFTQPQNKHLNQKSPPKIHRFSPEVAKWQTWSKKSHKHKVVTCKNWVAVSAVWPTAISKKDETMLCLSDAESTPSITIVYLSQRWALPRVSDFDKPECRKYYLYLSHHLYHREGLLVCLDTTTLNLFRSWGEALWDGEVFTDFTFWTRLSSGL